MFICISMPTYRLLFGYSNLKRNGAYLTHFVNLLSFCTSKQLKAQWCEAKWFTEEIWYSLVPRNYIVQIPVIGLVFWRGPGPCGCHQLLGLWHLTRADLLWEQPVGWLYGITVSTRQPFFCRLLEHFKLTWKVFIVYPLNVWLARNLEQLHVIANKQ